MTQDFSGQDLQGKNFKGQDLTGANFSYADIRGTDFSKAILKGANFSYAKAGLQNRQAIFLMAVAFFISALAGLASGIGGLFASVFLVPETIKQFIVPGSITLIVLAILFFIIVRKGYLNAKEAWGNRWESYVAIAIPLSLFLAFLGAIVLTISVFLALSENYSGVVVLVILGVLVLTLALLLAIAMAGALVVAGPLAVAVTLIGTLAVAGAVARVLVVNNILNTTLAINLVIGGSIIVGFLANYIGVRSLNGAYEFVWIQMIAVNFAALGGTSFRGANLTDAIFTYAILKSTDFREAILKNTCFLYSKELSRSRYESPEYSTLSNPSVRELIVTGFGEGKYFLNANLRGAFLKGANLKYANLKGADLSGANLENASLEWANLSQVQAVGTNFTNANLTGACLEAWNIDSTTDLKQVNCQFIYLLEHSYPGTDNRERRPSSGEFAPGEFTKLFQEVINTVDLIFRDGVDWKAFITAFKKIQVENEGIDLAIQSIENKGDGVVVVRVSVPTDANKEKIHSEFTKTYQFALAEVEKRYKVELQAKDREIALYREKSADFKEMIGLLASREVKIINQPNLEHRYMSDNIKVNQSGTFGIGYSESVKAEQVGGTIHNYAEQLNLAEAAKDIQDLLQQLEETYPVNNNTEKMILVTEAVKQIESNPALKLKVIGALKAGGIAAFKELVNNPLVNILLAALEGWETGK